MPHSLTDLQRAILANAAKRGNRHIFPTPVEINKNAGALSLCLRSLVASGLIAEERENSGSTIPTDDGPAVLIISKAGLAAIGISGAEAADLVPTMPPAIMPTEPRETSKLACLIKLLSAPGGATIEDLVSATGWQKHSVRGAISGALKNKRKLNVTSGVIDGRGRVYRLDLSPAEAPVPPSSLQMSGGEQE